MTWEELALKIGDSAKEIIEQDRGEQMRNGKVVCFLTPHKSNPELSWLPTLANDPGKMKCCNCDECYSIIDHAKYLAHDDMKEAYRILCEFAGVDTNTPDASKSPQRSKKQGNSTNFEIKPETEVCEIEFPRVDPVSRQLTERGRHYLTGRGITRETLVHYRVSSDENAVYFNYFANDHLVKVKGRTIGDMTNSKDKYKHTPKGGSNVLYAQHIFAGQSILAICEGEIDALSLYSALKAHGLDADVLASSVPSGSGNMSWIENSLSFIKKFDAVVLVPDNDDAGRKFSDKASSILFLIIQTRIAEMNLANDCNDLLQGHGTQELCSVVVNAKEYIPDYSVDLAALPRKQDSWTYEKTGFFTLDKMLRGLGHGLVTVFTGHAGAGKTTIIRQILIFNAMSKRRVGAMLGEESAVMSREMLIKQAYMTRYPEMFTPHYDEFDNKTWIPNAQAYDLFDREISPRISYYKCALLQTPDRLKKIYEWINFESKIKKARLFIIDNMMKLEVGMGDNLFAMQGDIIDAIYNIAQTLSVHIILIAHPKKGQDAINGESVSGSQKIGNTVDNLISFQRFDNMDDKQASRLRGQINHRNEYDNISAFIRVHKNRVYGKTGYVAMLYDDQTNCIHDLDPQNKPRYGWTINGRNYANDQM